MTNQNNTSPHKKSFMGNIAGFFRNHPVISGLLSIFIVGVVMIWLTMIFLDYWTHHGDNSTVPEIKHMTYTDALNKLQEYDLGIEISDSVYDTTLPPGTIVESWPKAGSQVKRGRNVYVTLTAFSPKQVTISMPITGVSVRQAQSYLNALGINTVALVRVPSQYPDLVEKALYNGRPVGVGSVVPVDAKIVLEYGHYEPSVEEDDELLLDDNGNLSSEEIIYGDLSNGGQSLYVDDYDE